MSQQVTCSRCGRAFGPGDSEDQWNVIFKNGYVTGHLCPEHQTAKEWTEAEVNPALTERTFRPEPGSPEEKWALGEILKRNAVDVVNEWVDAYNAGNVDSFDSHELASELRRRVEKHAGPYSGSDQDFVVLIDSVHEALIEANEGLDDEDE